MSYNSSVYNQDYYKSHCGDNYERGNGWEEVFARQADRIVREINPKTSLDVGCAVGYLVEALRDRHVEAKGIDISSYAISKVREDIKPFCSVKSATDVIEGKYDLITCIEVMEHLLPEDFTVAIQNMCNATDTIIFSSTPFDFNEESHFSVNPPSFWVEKFAYNGFYHDVDYDCSYIAVQAMLFRRGDRSKVQLIRTYEEKMFGLWRENCTLRDSVNLLNARINDLDRGNIEHAQEVYRYNETIKQLTAQVQNHVDNQESLLQQKEGQIRELYSDEINKCNEQIVNLNGLLEEQKKVHEDILRQREEQISGEYAREILRCNETIKELSDKLKILQEEQEFAITQQVQLLYEDKSKSLNIEFSKKEERLRELLKIEYEKRDNLESKFSVFASKTEFLERELYRYMLMNEAALRESAEKDIQISCKEQEIVQKEKEIKKYSDSRLARWGYSIGYRLTAFKRHRVKRDNKKLINKGFEYWEPVFVAEEYSSYNPDVVQYIGDDRDKLLEHFVCYGMKEGRRAKSTFDIHSYRSFNPDVERVYGDDIKNIYIHYIEKGKNEGRRTL